MSRPLPSYRIGDLVWCRWNAGVWWPAMISYDPHNAVFFKATETAITQYHIQYFGIMARRGWVNTKLLVPLKGVEERKLTKKLNKKVLKDYEAAIAEATEAVSLDLKRRKLKFIFNFVSPSNRRKRTLESSTSSSSKGQKLLKTNEIMSTSSMVPSLPESGTSLWKPAIIEVPPSTVCGTSSTNDMYSITLEKTPVEMDGSQTNSSSDDQKDCLCESAVVKVESLIPSAHSVDYSSSSQATDSGFETGSDLSITPMVSATPTVTSITHQMVSASQLNSVHSPGPLVEPSIGVLMNGDEANRKGPSRVKPDKNSVTRFQSGQSKWSTMFTSCAICDNDGELVTCNGQCYQKFHLDCLGIIDTPPCGFTCDECLVRPIACFQCHKPSNPQGESLTPCDYCTKQYHKSCVSSIKSFKINDNKFICGLHSCAKCIHTNTFLTATNLVTCIQCPLALHKVSCLTAGCEILNETQMLCYKHFDLKSAKSVTHFNMNTCLDCGDVGSLVCCDFCSAAYHNHCLSDEHKAVDSAQEWLCPNCLAHDLPTYESVVLCKCGTHRWWPAEVIPGKHIPSSLWSSKPSPCMFLVKFFKTDQYFWTHHGRVIAFTDDCLLEQYKKKALNDRTKQGQIQAQYSEAFSEALTRYREWKSKIDSLKPQKKESKNYCPIKRNKYLVQRPPGDSITESCKCTPKSPCTPSSNCINRAVYTECLPSNCPVSDKCQNQKIRLAQNAPVATFYTGGRGWGLKATKDIENGDFVVEYIGEVLNMEMVRERLKASEERDVSNFYFLTLGKDLVIDASTKSNNARFINHSCDPNCQTQKWKVNGETRIGIFAIKDIPAGTELTFDYMFDSLGNEKKRCLCGSINCSGYLGVRPKNAQEIADALEPSPISTKKDSAVIFRSNLCKNDPYDDECYMCKQGGKLLLCDYPDCFRVYHAKCINLKKVPRNNFICPRHHCTECSSPAIVCCSYCVNAACHTHQASLVKLHDEYYCSSCHGNSTSAL